METLYQLLNRHIGDDVVGDLQQHLQLEVERP
jgi:hypothetical protein